MLRINASGPEIGLPDRILAGLLPGKHRIFVFDDLSGSLMRILDFSFDGGTENVTKWHWNSFPGLILGAFCIIFRA